MNTRLLLLVLTAGLAAQAPPATQAQQFIPLLAFTNSWRFNDSGTDQGTFWSSIWFDDSAWPEGRPLFGVETSLPFPYLASGFTNIATPLLLTAPGSNTQTITYYFRTRFHYPGTNFAGVVLTAHGYFDDGAVLFINGFEAGRVRVPVNQDWRTLSPPLPTASEGWLESTNLNLGLLSPGDNILAVELHQQAATSSDVVFGLALSAFAPQPLVITQQPLSQAKEAGTPAGFKVVVSGTPAFYQWRKDGTNLAGATQPSLTITNLTLAHAGDYTVQVTNAITVLTSAVATLTVEPATSPLRALSAVVSSLGATNQISVMFNRKLTAQSVNFGPSTSNNFMVHLAASGKPVDVTSVFYNAGMVNSPESFAVVRVGGPHWHIEGFSNYVMTINNVQEQNGQVIAPDTQLPVLWSPTIMLLGSNAYWRVHAAAVHDPGVFLEDWTSPAYLPGPAWSQGPGPFAGGAAVENCSGPFQTLLPFQPEPTLFRTVFEWPPSSPLNATLRLACAADDGVVIYLNGTEIVRQNVSGPITPFARASVSSSTCFTATIPVDQLLSGPNSLAAAMVQSGSEPPGSAPDAVFRLGLTATANVSQLPPPAQPTLLAQRLDSTRLRLAWTGPAFVLESATNLTQDPWLFVPNQSNPFTNSLTAAQQYFRLRR